MKTVYVSPKIQNVCILSHTMQMQTTSPFADPQGQGGTPIIGPRS